MSDTLKMVNRDDDIPEVLDEHGKPFFDPLDTENMYKKYADYADCGDDVTEENGIHGFWR